MPQRISVTNLDCFRWWREEEELPLDWLLKRFRGEEETEPMRLGKAFHEALESAQAGEVTTLQAAEYRFHFNLNCEVPIPRLREIAVEKEYGALLVRGRVDALHGREVTDYKVTQQFDADRLMTGYQWRYYLDMTECDRFVWRVFVVRELDANCYEVYQDHVLTQNRYPDLHKDCVKLAREYSQFASTTLALQETTVTEKDVQAALAADKKMRA